jgi:NADP-dependent 3-hydroxy acid dehydrogenase YdfG
MEAVFKTNFHGPLNITRAILPKLRAKGTGTLVFMGSQAGWQYVSSRPSPRTITYNLTQ